MNLNEKITFYRKQKGINKSQLAREIGVSPTYITLIEKGTNTPSIELIYKIAYSLGISPSELSPSLKGTDTSFFLANSDYLKKLKDIYYTLFDLQFKRNIMLNGKDIDDIILSTGINSYKSAFTDDDLKTIYKALKITHYLREHLYDYIELMDDDSEEFTIGDRLYSSPELSNLVNSLLPNELSNNTSVRLMFEINSSE